MAADSSLPSPDAPPPTADSWRTFMKQAGGIFGLPAPLASPAERLTAYSRTFT